MEDVQSGTESGHPTLIIVGSNPTGEKPLLRWIKRSTDTCHVSIIKEEDQESASTLFFLTERRGRGREPASTTRGGEPNHIPWLGQEAAEEATVLSDSEAGQPGRGRLSFREKPGAGSAKAAAPGRSAGFSAADSGSDL